MCKAHQHEEYGWIDVLNFLNYLEAQYGGTFEITLAASSETSEYALLCVNGADYCPRMEHRGFQICAVREVHPRRLSRLHEEARDLLFETQEAVEGNCPYCRSEVGAAREALS